MHDSLEIQPGGQEARFRPVSSLSRHPNTLGVVDLITSQSDCCDYNNMEEDGSYLSLESLSELRERANQEAQVFIRRHISARQATESVTPTDETLPSSAAVFPIMPVQSYACLYTRKYKDQQKRETSNSSMNIVETDDSIKECEIEFLTPTEELALIRFYSSKIFSLIGPNAQIARLQKDVKVASTAALLFIRFFLSNSVMMFDPKSIMVAAVFLASKVEDATVDIRLLEEGTQAMNAAVSISEILNAEMHLIEGVNFELLYFHPYNSIMAFTEDLRTFLKSEVGSTLVSFMKTEDDPDSHRILTGDDLRPMHDEARRIIDDAVVSDIPLLASPGQIGLCSLIVAGEALIQGTVMRQGDLDSEPQKQPQVPRINFHEYIKHRFSTDHKEQDIDKILVQIDQVCSMLRALKEGNFGCGNPPIEELKKIHKKLKACHAWGGGPSMEGRKKKKRKREDARE